MTPAKKIIFRVLIVVLIVVIISVGFIQLGAKKEVHKFLDQKIPSHIKLTYANLKVNVLTGFVGFEDVSLTIYNRDTLLFHTITKIKALNIEGLDYWQFITNNTIEVENFIVDNPKLHYYPHQNMHKKDSVPKGIVNLSKTIIINKIALRKGEFTIIKEGIDSVKVNAKDINFVLLNGKTDSEIIKNKIPLEFKDYSFTTSNLFVDLSPYEKLDVKLLTVDSRHIDIEDLLVRSKYNKRILSRKLKTERDHISLKIPRLNIKNIDFGFRKDQFYISVDSSEIYSPILEIYRDKVLPDDLRHKKLYGHMLRELPIAIDIPKLRIIDGYLGYEEKVGAGLSAGRIFFSKLDTEITALSNTGADTKKTNVTAQTLLMGESQLNINWSFNVKRKIDVFDVSGALSEFSEAHINSFLIPNLGAKAQGTINHMYFTISGNSRRSTGDMKMKYHDFRFEIMGKDRHKVNKIKTAIGNLFVNDGSKADAQGFRYGKIHAERDSSKSFFNYLWLNVRQGIISTMTGSGKKER